MTIRFSRRSMLQGLGLSLALPSLEILAPRRAHADPVVAAQKLVMLLKPNGHHRPLMTADAVDGSLRWGAPLKPLSSDSAALARSLLLTGLDNIQRHRDDNGNIFDVHHPIMMLLTAGPTLGVSKRARASRASFDVLMEQSLTTSRFTYVADTANNPQRVNGNRYLDKIEKSCHSWTQGNAVDGFSRGHTKLRAAYEALFGVASSDPDAIAAARALRARKKSLIDGVKPQADSMRGRLGRADQLELDAYLSGLHELGAKIDGSGTCSQASSGPYETEVLRPLDVETKLVLDLIAYALSCGRTRVATFLMDIETSERRYDFVPVTQDFRVGGRVVARGDAKQRLNTSRFHGEVSHYTGGALSMAAAAAVDEWHVSQFVYLVNRLRGMPGTNGGTMLDECTVVQTGALSHGNSHDSHDLPVLVAGSLVSRGARHLRFSTGNARYAGEAGRTYQGRPFADLLVTLAAHLGAPLASFGNSTGALSLA